MSENYTEGHITRYASLDDIPSKPLSEEFKALTDEEIEANRTKEQIYPEGFWDDAKIVYPEPKKQVTLRLDSEILSYFKAQGKGYQTMINSVLKSYVQAKQ